jgi:DNA-binding transcriptional regulator YiaG
VELEKKPEVTRHTPEELSKLRRVYATDMWEKNRARKIQKMNANRRPSPVRELRMALNMSQSEFARAIGLSESNAQRISQIENGLIPPPHLIGAMHQLAQSRNLEWEYSVQ